MRGLYLVSTRFVSHIDEGCISDLRGSYLLKRGFDLSFVPESDDLRGQCLYFALKKWWKIGNEIQGIHRRYAWNSFDLRTFWPWKKDGARVYTRFWSFWAFYERVQLIKGRVIHEVLISLSYRNRMIYEVCISHLLSARPDLRGFDLRKDTYI